MCSRRDFFKDGLSLERVAHKQNIPEHGAYKRNFLPSMALACGGILAATRLYYNYTLDQVIINEIGNIRFLVDRKGHVVERLLKL